MLISYQSFHEDDEIDPEEDAPAGGDVPDNSNVGLISVH